GELLRAIRRGALRGGRPRPPAPLDPDTALAAWGVCEAMGLELPCRREPLARPRDRFLAERVVANRALVRATDGAGLDVDLSIVMAGFDFETAWAERRV